MLHENDRGFVFQQQRLDLHPGDHIDIVHGLVPDVQMHGLADRSCQQHLFLLPGAETGHILFHLGFWHIQLCQHGKEQAFVDSRIPGEVRQLSPQAGCILIDIGNLQPISQPKLTCIWYSLTAKELDDTALAARVKAIEDDYLTEADKYDDTAVVGRVAAIEGDYLKQADKTALQGGIDANAQAIAGVKEDVDAFFKDADLTETAKDTLKEIQDYINSDASAASEMTASIQQNTQAITAVEGRIGTAEGKITTLEGKAHEHANKTVLDGITADKVAVWDTVSAKASQEDLDDAIELINANTSAINSFTPITSSEVEALFA